MSEQGDGYLACSCCGRTIRDDPEHNISHGVVPYPHDVGCGLCRSCGGDPKAKTRKRRMGWQARMFFDARIRLLKERLDPPQREKFKAMDYERQVAVVTGLIEKGHLI